ncbi:FAD-dependent 5-carboxymethylaminomethyl-2-thiouridine(34) oxidoreductase MnmC, partial [Accumulibacter sp.]
MDRRAIVVGAGLAGTAAAAALAARGWRISLIDAEPGPGQGASGNRAGVLRPLPSVDDNRLARLTRAAFRQAVDHLHALARSGAPVRWQQTGVLHLARDARHEATQQRVVAEQRPAPGEFCFVDREPASRLTGWPVSSGGWWFPGGGWVDPASLCRANLARHASAIATHFSRPVDTIAFDAGLWRACDAAGQPIGEAPVLVLANAAAARRFAVASHLPLREARGQVTHLPAAPGSPPPIVVCRLGYVTPPVDDLRCAGATFAIGDRDSGLREADQRENLARLELMLPGFRSDVDPDRLGGRVGFRPLSPDRLPMIGQIADAREATAGRPARTLDQLPRVPGLYVVDGFGARGIVWSALAGELLACQITGERLPLADELVAAVDPGRFVLR